MGVGNWTWLGASSIQLLSLGRWSSTKSGLKSAWDTWHYQLCFNANWELRCPEATASPRPVCGSLICVSFWKWGGGLTNSVGDCDVRMPLCKVWGGGGGLWEQQGFGVNYKLCQGLAVVDYRARCPSVLNKRMSRMKRLCVPVCCKLGFTAHIKDQQQDQEPQADMMGKSIDSTLSAGHLDYYWDGEDDCMFVVGHSIQTEAMRPYEKCNRADVHSDTEEKCFFASDDIHLGVPFYSTLSFLNSKTVSMGNGVLPSFCDRR